MPSVRFTIGALARGSKTYSRVRGRRRLPRLYWSIWRTPGGVQSVDECRGDDEGPGLEGEEGGPGPP